MAIKGVLERGGKEGRKTSQRLLCGPGEWWQGS